MRATLLLVGLLVFATGCKNDIAIVDVTDPIVNDDDAPTHQVNLLYLKGPTELQIGSSGNFRAEPVVGENVDIYEWRVFGEGEISTTYTDPEGFDRLVSIRGVGEGEITLSFRALDANGEQLGYGEKVISIIE